MGKLAKIKDFAELACCYQLPFVTFLNVGGIQPTMAANDSRVMKEAAEYLDMLDTVDTAKIAVVYGKAVGWAIRCSPRNRRASIIPAPSPPRASLLFDSAQGAVVELGKGKESGEALQRKYAEENSDPINAAKDGYIDAVIEPQYVKQYLTASLQMLAR